MSHGRSDADLIRTEHNVARFFSEHVQISWVLLLATIAWGVYGYARMPKRKDPEFPINQAVVVCPWPGVSAERIEQFVTRKLEEGIAENSHLRILKSTSLGNVAIVEIELDENLKNMPQEFDDIRLRLDAIRDLPSGAGPIQLLKDYGDTATLMLTVASPPTSDVEIAVRARGIRAAIEGVRAGAAADAPGRRVTLLVSFPASLDARLPRRQRDLVMRYAAATNVGRDLRPVEGTGFTGIDLVTDADDRMIAAFIEQVFSEQLHPSEFHPDVWQPVAIRDPADTERLLTQAAGDKYSYHELDLFTDLIKRSLQTLPVVSKVIRTGRLEERVYLEYSQERLASTGIPQVRLSDILTARNTQIPGGVFEISGKSLMIDPAGEFKNEAEIGDVMLGASDSGAPMYLRDGVAIARGYESPPRFLNFYTWRDAGGHWRRSRAITLSVHMRADEQVANFGAAVDRILADLKGRVPDDLIMARTSDQPQQVTENVDLFMRSLYEAIVLVVLVALVGFWEWRAALLMALSIPVTLAMTFGMMDLLGLDIQQVSIASLIIALGLLVDDPVVAGDGIKRELDAGHLPVVSAWLGPTKLATAILFATITNIVAYLPLLLVTGKTGKFIYTLPMVLTCSLVASRIVSMTFIPLLGRYLLRPTRGRHRSAEERRQSGFTGFYYRFVGKALDHRWLVLATSVVFLAGGGLALSGLKRQFFPKDLSYLSYVDVWLPEDATLGATNETAQSAERVIRDTIAHVEAEEHNTGATESHLLRSITTFVGGGGPRFWFSVSPELRQLNYSQLVLQVDDKHATAHLVPILQRALSEQVPGARLDVRQLETGKPVGLPVAVRISGDDIPTLRRLAAEAAAIFQAVPTADRVRDDWGGDKFVVRLQVDADRANLAGVTNQDVAISSAVGMNGYTVTTLREGDKEIPVLIRMRTDERAQVSDIENLYVFGRQANVKVPLRQVASFQYDTETEKIRRRQQFRTITVAGFPIPGVLPSEVLNAAMPRLRQFETRLPPGYRMEIGGEAEAQVEGFRQLSGVMGVSVVAIFLALVVQFRHALKPLIVFSAIPYGLVGALAALALMHAPFGFMAFLGVASLIGVIVSHVIVLFDFIEEMRTKGEPVREALLDAGIVRLRPVMITVGATVFGLVPLALHGGPLWEPLCYTQIGGLVVATFVTLLLVPVLYAICVLDLKVIGWPRPGEAEQLAAEMLHM